MFPLIIPLSTNNAEGITDKYNDFRSKKAKPALCFARIAKAILGDVTLHNSNFLFQNVKRYALFYRAYLLLIDRKMLVT